MFYLGELDISNKLGLLGFAGVTMNSDWESVLRAYLPRLLLHKEVFLPKPELINGEFRYKIGARFWSIDEIIKKKLTKAFCKPLRERAEKSLFYSSRFDINTINGANAMLKELKQERARIRKEFKDNGYKS